jgi:hypothetical protein
MLLFSLSVITANGQKNNAYPYSTTGRQFGLSLKLQAEIGVKKNTHTWRAGLSAGAGSFLSGRWIYPSLHTDLMLYHGGIGSNWPHSRPDGYFKFELAIAYTVTVGAQNRLKTYSNLNPLKRHYPLYYLNTFNVPPLQNPFIYSASIGGNAIFFIGREKNNFQQVGMLNLHLDRVQLSYTNDGPPFFQPFGDKYDRLHTGGGWLSLHGNNNWPINLFEMGFNKFTGFNKNTYELSGQAGIIYLYYKDEEQQYYNRSHFYFNVANTTQRWGVNVNIYNNNRSIFDIQHMIHQSLFYPLHIVPYKSYVSVGASFYYNTTQIGLK